MPHYETLHDVKSAKKLAYKLTHDSHADGWTYHAIPIEPDSPWYVVEVRDDEGTLMGNL